MTNEEKRNISDIAADKLSSESTEAAAKFSGTTPIQRVQKVLAEEIGKMLTRFCYQNEEFAQAVDRCDKTLTDIVEGITSTTSGKAALSDVEAYAAAVKYYLPAAQVIVSFRVNLPDEFDDDLLVLEDDANSAESQAIILDLFNTEE